MVARTRLNVTLYVLCLSHSLIMRHSMHYSEFLHRYSVNHKEANKIVIFLYVLCQTGQLFYSY